MIKNRIDPQQFIKKLRSILSSEKRNPLEIGAKKRPKMEFLMSITDVIELLFDNLYSVSEQLYLINTIDKNFSLTDTTYFKFLNTYLKDEYIVLKKNRLLVSKIKTIKEAHDVFPNSTRKQFDLLDDFSTKHEISFEDYTTFLDCYYLKNSDSFFVKKTIDRYGESESIYVPCKGHSLKRKTIITKEPDTIYNILDSLIKIEKPQKYIKKVAAVQSISLRNSASTKKDTYVQNFTNIFENEVADSKKRFHLVSGVDVNVLPDNIKIIRDISMFPREVLGTSFMFSDLCYKSNTINEEYLYLKDIRYIQWLDIKRLKLKDGLLVIEGRRSTQVFLSYRYYKNDLYLIEESQWNPDEHRIKDDLNRAFDKDSSVEVLAFEEKLAEIEKYPSR